MKTNLTTELNELTYKLNGIAMKVHRVLGHGFAEAVYKEALEYEFQLAGIPYEREKEFKIRYLDIILKTKYRADFVVYGDILIEAKAQHGIAEGNFRQVINYLAVSKSRIGLIYNFGTPSLMIKRLLLGDRADN